MTDRGSPDRPRAAAGPPDAGLVTGERRLEGVRAVTLDFGNTLVPVGRAALRAVVERTAAEASAALALGTPSAFLAAWAEERDRQFRIEVPRFHEVSLPDRAARVVARLRGLAPPAGDDPWDDDAVARLASPAEVDVVVERYSRCFVAGIPAPPESGAVVRKLARRGFQVAILSNWPLAATIDRVAEAAGWLPWLSGIFVSQRIGTIKPHPAIFDHALASLGRRPTEMLHAGDDWAADVVGAASAGWRTAYLHGHQGDTPLPTSRPAGDITPDLVLGSLAELPSRLADPPVDSGDGGS